MQSRRFLSALPYAVLFGLAAWFYHLAGEIAFTRRGDNIGPDFWPRMALAAIMIICAVQGARLLIFGRANSTPGVVDVGEEDDDAPRSRLLLIAGVVLTVGYGLLMPIVGFLTGTFLFMVLFMYAGHYRGHLPIFLSSLFGALLVTILFQKVVYVSLPRGVPPFDRLADFILNLF